MKQAPPEPATAQEFVAKIEAVARGL